MVRHIGIVGSFGSGNVGDEAAWMAVQEFFISKNPGYRWNIHIFQWGQPYLNNAHHITPLYMLTTEDITFINQNFEAFIITGGGIIGQQWGLTKMPHLIPIINAITIPIYCISISAEDEQYSAELCTAVSTLLTRARLFTVRDQYSATVLCRRLGLAVPPQVTPDVVTVLPCALPHLVQQPQNTTGQIVLVTHSDCCVTEYLEFYRKVFDASRPDVMVMPFQPSSNEILSSQSIATAMRFGLSIHPFLVQSDICAARMLIAGRLHACVLAAKNGVPFFAINYHPKVKSFCDSIGHPYYYPQQPIALKDITGYGYDFCNFDADECIRQIREYSSAPVLPHIEKDATEILERVYKDICAEHDHG